MSTDLILPPQQLTLDLPIARAGAAANASAARRVFLSYRDRLADHTRRRHDSDLATFATYLGAIGLDTVGDTTLSSDPRAWAGITWGLVAGFVAWQSSEGYAIGSINVRLSTVKTYARLAAKAGALSADEYAQIKLVEGFRHAEGRRIDAKRETTRKGGKKAAPVSISEAHAELLKNQADPQDRLLMCLLLDHGLRVGEVASLVAEDFDLSRGVLRFYRSKVDKTQSHRLSTETLAACLAFPFMSDKTGVPLFGVERTIQRRVAALGARVGLARLSPHDARHYWATAALRAGTPIKALQDAGGWSSPAMPLRYAESAEIANDGVKLR